MIWKTRLFFPAGMSHLKGLCAIALAIECITLLELLEGIYGDPHEED